MHDEAPRGNTFSVGDAIVFCGAAAVLCLALPLTVGDDAGYAAAVVAPALSGCTPVLSLLLGRAALLMPLGDATARLVVLGALAGALAAWLGARATARLCGGGRLGAAAGVTTAALMVAALGSSHTSGIEATLTAMGGALLLALAASPGGRPAGERASDAGLLDDPARSLAPWLCAGLCLALDGVFRLALVPLAVHALWRLRRGERWPLLAPFALALGSLALFGGPVLRAASGLGASSPQALLWSLWRLPQPRWSGALYEQVYALPALLAAMAGVVALARRARLVLAIAALLVVGGLLNLSDEAGMVAHLGGAALAALAVLAGVGVGAVARWTGRRAIVNGGADEGADALAELAAAARCAALGGVAVVATLASGFGSSTLVESQAATALRSAPPRAVILARDDGLRAALAYAQASLRPDVTVLARDRLDDAAALRLAAAQGGGVLDDDTLAAWSQRPPRARLRDSSDLLEALLRHNLGRRALLWEPGPDDDATAALPIGHLVPDVPFFRVEPRPSPEPAPVPLARRALVDGDADPTSATAAISAPPREPVARLLAARALGALGAHRLRLGDLRTAQALLVAALRLVPPEAPARDVAALRVPLAAALARAAQPERALALLEPLVRPRSFFGPPADVPALLLAARLQLRVGRLDAAEPLLRRALRAAPDSAAPRLGLARLAHARGDDRAAARLVEEALRYAPDDREARALARRYAEP